MNMKKTLLFLITALFFVPVLSLGQSKSYWVTTWEVPLQFASIESSEPNSKNIVRFAPIINLQSALNVDPSKAFGITVGIGVRNVGFIYDLPQDAVKVCCRRRYVKWIVSIRLIVIAYYRPTLGCSL